MSPQESTIENVVNAPEIVEAFGRKYEIKRFTMGPLVRALPHIAPLGYLLRSAQQGDVSDILVNALAVAGEPAMGLLCVATSEPVEWFEDKDPIECLKLIRVIIEKNAPYFFDSANLDLLQGEFMKIGAVIEKFAPKSGGATSIP